MNEKIQNWNTIVDFINDAEVAEIVFTKKDGSTRTMVCTRDPRLIPPEHHPKGPPKEETKFETVSVFELTGSSGDVKTGQWRSFKVDSIISKRKI